MTNFDFLSLNLYRILVQIWKSAQVPLETLGAVKTFSSIGKGSYQIKLVIWVKVKAFKPVFNKICVFYVHFFLIKLTNLTGKTKTNNSFQLRFEVQLILSVHSQCTRVLVLVSSYHFPFSTVFIFSKMLLLGKFNEFLSQFGWKSV
jgi:hypothetical protein